MLVDSTSLKVHPYAAGQKNAPQAPAIGRSRGGLNPKLPAAVDAVGNVVHLHLSGGQEADCKNFDEILDQLPPQTGAVVADKAYDTGAIVKSLETRGAHLVIPAKASRLEPRELDENLYEDRNKVERFFSAHQATSCYRHAL